MMLLAAIGLASGLPAHLDGATLLAMCDRDEMVCGAYIVGVADALAYDKRNGLCLPSGPEASVEALVTIVREWFRGYEFMMQEAAAWNVAGALADRFPCE